MQLRHDPTFFWATCRLPREVRPAVHALYGYVRGADEIVDGFVGRSAAAAERRRRLDAWEHALRQGRAQGGSAHPVIAALVDAAATHDLPLDELHVYMDSMRIDCGRVRIESDDELDRYMNGSAAAVGRLMAPLLACDVPEDVASLGVAFQLTNFIRDVREDWAMDRVYLPGLGEDELARGEASPALRERVAAEVARARALFARTSDVAEHCERAVAPGIRLARAVYARVLDHVEEHGFDVVGRSGAPPRWQLTRAAVVGLRAG
jgi:phytoene synthase